MFAQHTFIAKQHHVALESTIRNHSVASHLSAQMVVTMYRLALDGLTGPVKADGYAVSILSTVLPSPGIKLCAITDVKSGLYLQLAKVGDRQPLLTLGQKWVMESAVAEHGNIATTLW